MSACFYAKENLWFFSFHFIQPKEWLDVTLECLLEVKGRG